MTIKEQSQRQLRVGQEIKKIIAGEINQGKVRNLEVINALVTVVEAQVSSDLKYADVYFITSDPNTDEQVLEALQLASGHFRKVVAAKTALRFVPEIRFRIDESFAQADKIEKLLHDPKVYQDIKKN